MDFFFLDVLLRGSAVAMTESLGGIAIQLELIIMWSPRSTDLSSQLVIFVSSSNRLMTQLEILFSA